VHGDARDVRSRRALVGTRALDVGEEREAEVALLLRVEVTLERVLEVLGRDGLAVGELELAGRHRVRVSQAVGRGRRQAGGRLGLDHATGRTRKLRIVGQLDTGRVLQLPRNLVIGERRVDVVDVAGKRDGDLAAVLVRRDASRAPAVATR